MQRAKVTVRAPHGLLAGLRGRAGVKRRAKWQVRGSEASEPGRCGASSCARAARRAARRHPASHEPCRHCRPRHRCPSGCPSRTASARARRPSWRPRPRPPRPESATGTTRRGSTAGREGTPKRTRGVSGCSRHAMGAPAGRGAGGSRRWDRNNATRAEHREDRTHHVVLRGGQVLDLRHRHAVQGVRLGLVVVHSGCGGGRGRRAARRERGRGAPRNRRGALRFTPDSLHSPPEGAATAAMVPIALHGVEECEDTGRGVAHASWARPCAHAQGEVCEDCIP